MKAELELDLLNMARQMNAYCQLSCSHLKRRSKPELGLKLLELCEPADERLLPAKLFSFEVPLAVEVAPRTLTKVGTAGIDCTNSTSLAEEALLKIQTYCQ